MGNEDSDDEKTTDRTLKALEDSDCRQILKMISSPMSATEISEDIGVSESTTYRKLELLSEASLIEEDHSIKPGGGRITYYKRACEEVHISIDADGFKISIDRPKQTTDERLADIWGEMGDEL